MLPMPSLKAIAVVNCLSLPNSDALLHKLVNETDAITVEKLLKEIDAFPLEKRRTLPLLPQAPTSYLERVISSRIEFLSTFTAKYHPDCDFLHPDQTNVRERPRERGQCLVELLKFCQDENCPLPLEAKERFTKEIGKLRATCSLLFIDLSGEDLSGLDLSNLNLNFAKCKDTNFSGTTITGTHFSEAVLENADFSKANGRRPYFVGANLTSAVFTEATLEYPNF